MDNAVLDGTLIQAWAGQKSFHSKDGSDDDDGADFRGQKRSNDTHQSSTDPDARLYKKSYGKESKPSYPGHALVENRNGLIAVRSSSKAIEELPDPLSEFFCSVAPGTSSRGNTAESLIVADQLLL